MNDGSTDDCDKGDKDDKDDTLGKKGPPVGTCSTFLGGVVIVGRKGGEGVGGVDGSLVESVFMVLLSLLSSLPDEKILGIEDIREKKVLLSSLLFGPSVVPPLMVLLRFILLLLVFRLQLRFLWNIDIHYFQIT